MTHDRPVLPWVHEFHPRLFAFAYRRRNGLGRLAMKLWLVLLQREAMRR
jgi:hypothetical protein